METEEKIVIMIAIIAFVLFLGGGLALRKASCFAAYENYQPQWGIISGCRIMVDEKLTPVEIIRKLK